MKTKSTFILLNFFALIFISGCSTTPEVKKVAPEQATALQAKEFNEAEQLYKKKKTPLASKKLQTFIQNYPNTEYTDDAAYYLAIIYYDQGDYFKAARYWLSIVDGTRASQYYDQSIVGAANAQTQLARYDEALELLKKFRIKDNTDNALAIQALELSSRLKLQKGNSPGAALDLMSVADLKENQQDKQLLWTKVADIINGNMSQKQLDEIIGNEKFSRLEPQARYRLATLHFDQKNWSTARKQFVVVAEKFPNTEFSKRAQQYLSTIDALERTDATSVGVVLPLSGKHSQMGYKTLRGIQMGMGLFNKSSDSPIKLAIIDSEGNADVARRGVEKLVSQDHVVAILGDIVSKTAQAVAIKAQELGVPCITLTQKQGITEIGNFIFRSTLTPDAQMQSLVDVAMTQRGYKRFAIIFPNDSYGTEYATAFWDHVLIRGGQVMAAQTYRPEEKDFRDVIQRLVGTYYAEDDRGKELSLRLAAWQKEQTSKSAREKPPKDLLPPAIDFDAIFIPDSPKTVGQVAAMLAYNDVNKIPLLGTNLWNSPQFIERGGKFIENSLFIDDYFQADLSPFMKRFTTDFNSQFGYKPDVFEAQGYDAASLLDNVLKGMGYSTTRVALRDRLLSATGVNGATGPLKMSYLREVEKSLIPLTVIKGQIVKSDNTVGAAQ
ncbi:MAG: penicillin-binding protein activator [Oligoflexia bacterium]|nr:penicillin-binding protein activator [Oligoflexia bacterium]